MLVDFRRMLAQASLSLSLTICCMEKSPADGSIFSLSLDGAVSSNKSLLFNATIVSFKRGLLVMLLSVAGSLLQLHLCFQFLFSSYLFDLCNLKKKSVLIFHTNLSMCFNSFCKEKEIVDSKEVISVFRLSVLNFSDMLSLNVSDSIILLTDSLLLMSF